MKAIKIIPLILVSLIIGALCAWFLRGEYDKHLMMEGRFHIVSTASQDYDVVLKFPSGEYASFNLKKGGTFNFKQTHTGEGSITVVINEKYRDQIGYVTSMNSVVILTVGDKKTGFSQIFPSLDIKQGAASDADKLRL